MSRGRLTYTRILDYNQNTKLFIKGGILDQMGKYKMFINSERLKLERYKKNISMREMADRLGWESATSYKNLEDGNVEPRITIMLNVSKILERPVHYFFNFNVHNSCIGINVYGK